MTMISDMIQDALDMENYPIAQSRAILHILEALSMRLDASLKTQQEDERTLCPKCGHLFYRNPDLVGIAEKGAVEYAITKIEEALHDLHCFMESHK